MNDMAKVRSTAPLTYEEMEDQRDSLDARLASILASDEDVMPLATVKRLSEGENPVLVWREHRGMSLPELAAAADLSNGDIAALEMGGVEPGLRAMARIAAALRVDIDDLVPWAQD
jgi:DNA-binding XRE family transcriptional regulator